MNRREFLEKVAVIGGFAVVQPWQILRLLDTPSLKQAILTLQDWEVTPASLASSLSLGTQTSLGTYEIAEAIRDFGCQGNGTADDTTNLSSFFNNTAGVKLKIFDAGTYKTTMPLNLPTGGTRVQGVGSGNDFFTILQPTNCAAFDLTNARANSVLQNFMIQPKGNSNPDFFIRLDGTGDIVFRDIRLHIDVNDTIQCNTAAVIQQNTANRALGTVFERVTIRTDHVALNYPVAYKFSANCGTCSILNPVVETSNIAFQHLGGQITVMGGTTERIGSNIFSFNPTTDAYASFAVHGGTYGASASAWPVAIRDGCKNTKILGAWISNGNEDVPTAPTQQVFVYGLSGSKNILLDLTNFDENLCGTAVTLDPSIIEFRKASPARHEIIAYSASMTPTFPLSAHTSVAVMTITNNTAFTINVPAATFGAGGGNSLVAGSLLTCKIVNTSGAGLGVATFGTGYKIGAAWTQPANGFSRSITFEYDGTNWVEISRTAADVAN